MRKSFQESGFTIIELIVVFSIIAILSVIGVAAFVNYSRIQILEAAASDLSSTLLVAKSRAISQVKPSSQIPQCDNSAILNGYRVILCPTSSSDVLCTANNSYVLAVRCSNVDYRIKSSVLPKNVVFSPSPTSLSFYFPVISSGVKGAGTITLTLTTDNNIRTITVDPIGGIQTQ